MTIFILTSSNGNVFRVTGHLCGEFTGLRLIPRTEASDAKLWCFLWIGAWINGWENNGEARDLRRHQAHYDVTVMFLQEMHLKMLPTTLAPIFFRTQYSQFAVLPIKLTSRLIIINFTPCLEANIVKQPLEYAFWIIHVRDGVPVVLVLEYAAIP